MAADRKRPARAAACVLLVLLVLLCASGALSLIWPKASGDDRTKKNGTVVDYSHASQGYVMVKHKKSKKTLKCRIEKDDISYTYDLNGEGEYEVFPLQMGSGKYNVRVYQQISGNRYSQASSLNFKAKLSDENAPYLCPNQYVWYEETGSVVALSDAVCEGRETQREKADAIRGYIASNYAYNFLRALTVPKGYMPDIEATIQEKSGICFDIASLAAAMYRVQGIPAKLVIGYADRAYHAWNDVYLDGAFERVDITSQLTATRAATYTEERVY